VDNPIVGTMMRNRIIAVVFSMILLLFSLYVLSNKDKDSNNQIQPTGGKDAASG
jgi:hypothetical protein